MKSKSKLWWGLLILAVAAYVIKNIFVGADTDESYAVAVGYRLAIGDRMMLEMWEPHQTSAIFTALFIKPFLWITGGATHFLNIYLRVIYFALQGAIAAFMYKTFCKCLPELSKRDSLWLSLVFFVSSPKSIFIPEYTNLQIWFFALLALCLMWYYCEASPMRGKLSMLVWAGLCLTCDVLAYPSMAILLPVCLIFIFWKHVKNPIKECLTLVVPCVVSAAIFLGYVLSYMTLEQVLYVIPFVLGDGSHKLDASAKLLSWLADFKTIGIVLAATLALAFLGAFLYSKSKRASKERFGTYVLIYFFVFQVAYQFYCWLFGEYNAAQPHLIYLALMLVGFYTYFKAGKKEKVGCYLMVFSFGSYVGIILMSNWGPIILLSYLIIGAMGGLLCWNTWLRELGIQGKTSLLQILCGILVVSNVFGFCWLIIGGEEGHSTLLDVQGIHKSGFRAGIFTTYMNAYRYNTNAEQWPDAVPDGSTVLYIGPSQFFYMLGDCTIASPNTISTPTYDESLFEYWEMNPDRYPDVIVVESWFGDIWVDDEHGFIMDWIENEYEATVVEDYSYVRVYKK